MMVMVMWMMGVREFGKRGVIQRWQLDNAEKEEEEGRDIPSHLQWRTELLDGPGYACMHGWGKAFQAPCTLVYFVLFHLLINKGLYKVYIYICS